MRKGEFMEFCDLKRQYQLYQSEIDAAMAAVIKSGQFIGGPEVAALELELAQFCGASHTIACANGTDALQLALMALDLKSGDEVIVPAFSFFATAEMPALCGARLRFADINPLSYQMDPQSVQSLINSKTAGIIAVSLYGQLAPLDQLQTLADEHGIWLLEDGAQSFGAKQGAWSSCGSAKIATTSFFPAKPLGCYGDGGAVFCQDDKLAERIRLLANHGSKQRYVHEAVGINSRLDALQAAVLRVKLSHFESELEHRAWVAQYYQDQLSDRVIKPQLCAGQRQAWAQYTIRFKDRDGLRDALTEKGIPTAVHYPQTLVAQSALKGHAQDPCPNAERAAAEVLSLPMHGCMQFQDLQKICHAVNEFLTK